MHFLISLAALLTQADIVPVQRQRLLIVTMGGQIKPQLINGKVQRHQLGKVCVGGREAGLQLSVEGKIQSRKQRAPLQGLAVIVPFGILILHGNIRKRHLGARPRQTAIHPAATCFFTELLGSRSFRSGRRGRLRGSRGSRFGR